MAIKKICKQNNLSFKTNSTKIKIKYEKIIGNWSKKEKNVRSKRKDKREKEIAIKEMVWVDGCLIELIRIR